MGRPVFGIALPGVQEIPGRCAPWERGLDGPALVVAARAAEAAGFAWVSCSDHPLVPASRVGVMGEAWLDAGSTLAFVAGATERIGLLAHVLVAPYRHPLLVAKQWGTLDHLSGGRVILGVGTGHVKPEFRILGADYERRGLVTDEALAAIAAAWEHTPASFEGQTVRFRDVVVAPRPARRPRPPFWVGGNSGAAVRRAARLGEGWIPWELTVDELRSGARRLRAWRREAGREDAPEIVVPLTVAADTDAGALRASLEPWREAGATGFHVGVRASSLPHFVDRLAWIASVVGAPPGPGGS
jgi:probable F420-dependent oxidoreductase